MIKANYLLLLVFLISYNIQAQVNCIRHWSKNKIPDTNLDSLLSFIQLKNIDTVYCDSFTVSNKFYPKFYITFFNKQFGNYFSKAGAVNFCMFHLQRKIDSLRGEIHITQFSFANADMSKIRKQFRERSKGVKLFKLEALTAYVYVVNRNSIYFIQTESFGLVSKHQEVFQNFINDFADSLKKLKH
jgi:hypothetical protein